uniref:BPI-like protein n=2 Tax=Spironucleus salmonicida TaxID=348837 RepID=V6LWS3_9EUKA|eukprot:EST49097.1 hypothetical protein SS50377_10631 [Spironucleus salmonicida]
MILLVLTVGCYQITFDNDTPKIEDSAMRVFVTGPGIERYANKNIKSTLTNLQTSISAMNIQFNIVGVLINLQNGRIMDVDLNDINIFLQNNSAILNVKHVVLDMIFELKLEQKTFPYLYDSGSLSLTIRDLGIQTYLSVVYGDNCKNKYILQTRNMVIVIDDFQIQFQCNNMVLLNSISLFITSYLKDLLNGELGQQFGSGLIESLLQLLNEFVYLAKSDYKSPITTDQRYFNGMQITENVIQVNSTGQRCIHNAANQRCYGYLNQTVTSTRTFFTNHDVQYQIEKLAFNSGFKLYLNQQRSFGGIQIVNITLTQFHNMGAELEVVVMFNGRSETLKFLEPVTFSLVRVNDQGTDFGRFVIRLTNLISVTSLKNEQIADLSSYFEKTFGEYDIVYANALGVSVEKAEVIYLDDNWIHIGSYIE